MSKTLCISTSRTYRNVGKNVRGTVNSVAEMSLSLWDTVKKRLGTEQPSPNCSCGHECYINPEAPFAEDRFTRYEK